ncbi:methyltransferase [Desertibaculum subflavum]|uniref:methyltransferase n=1 Tax=Desertibaculum subflavum TaxID=2268458 RepID=UPI0013C52954
MAETAGTAGTGRVDTVRLQMLAQAYQRSAALFAAVEIDLFTAVEKGAGSVEALAEALGISPRNAARIVPVLLALGLLERRDGRLANAADVQRFLVRGEPSYAGPWMLFTKPRWTEWGRLAEHLKAQDTRPLGMYESFTVDDARKYHQATYSVGMGAGRRFVREVDLAGRKKLLDLGGGSGAYSINAVQKWTGLRAVVFDLPPVAVVAREFIQQNGVADRVEAMAGDFTRDAFPPGCDVAVMASNLPQYDAAIIAEVIARTFAALAPGGEMHLIGEMLDDDGAGPIGPALWGLSEALFHSTGRAHTEAECLGYFRAAGFVDLTVKPFIPGVLTRVTGRKPG